MPIVRTLFVGAAAIMLAVACARTTPAPLPSGATVLKLKTQPPPQFALIRSGCNSALISPVVIKRDGDSMVFVLKDDGTPLGLVWPAGFSARALGGTAELVTPVGNVYGREGDVLSHLIGAAADNGDALICFASPDDYLNSPQP